MEFRNSGHSNKQAVLGKQGIVAGRKLIYKVFFSLPLLLHGESSFLAAHSGHKGDQNVARNKTRRKS